MTGSHADTIRVMLDAFCRGDAALAASYFAEDGVLISPTTGEETRGRPAIEEHMRHWLATFPDPVMTELELIAAGDDKIVALITAEATHVGVLRGHPGTGRRWRLRFCEVYRFDAAGKIVRDDAFYDLHHLLTQLGLA